MEKYSNGYSEKYVVCPLCKFNTKLKYKELNKNYAYFGKSH